MNTLWITGTWFPMFINLCVQSTVVLMAAALALIVFRARSSAFRHQIAATAMGILLVLPLLTVLPSVRRGAIPRLPQARAGSPSTTRLVRETPGRETTRAQSVITRKVSSSATAAVPDRATPVRTESGRNVATTPATTATSSTPITAPVVAVLALGVWLSGVMLLFVRFTAGYVRLFLVARRCSKLQDGPLKAWVGDLTRRTGFRRPISFLQDTPLTSIDVPITWGTWNPVILLPRGAVGWPEGRLRAVLLHELAHVRRGDWAAQAMAQMACALFWFHPLGWYVQRRMQEEAECACDDDVLLSGVAATEYAGHLLDIVRGIQGGRAHGAAVGMARGRQVAARMRTILDARLRRKPASRRILTVATVVTAAALLPTAWLRPLAAQTASTPDKGRIPMAGLQRAWVLSALVPVSGPGVEITLSDSEARPQAGSNPSTALIHDRDIAEIVNELKAAGAEAVAVGDQRLGALTVIRAVGPTITVNDIRQHPPFVIRAIGNPDWLLGVMNARRERVENLRRRDPNMVRTVKSNTLNLPGFYASRGGRGWAREVPSGEDTGGAGALRYIRGIAGLTDVNGPGVAVTLSDSNRPPAAAHQPGNALIHDLDIADVLDQLRTGGAEAITVGDERVVATTAIQTKGPSLLVNGRSITAPYVIHAIGDPDLLLRALNRPNGTVDAIRRVDPSMARVERAESLHLSGYSGSEPQYVRPVIVPLMAPEPQGGPSGQTITFADGTGVELIAVGSSPSGTGDDWWKPDGTPLVEAPVKTNNRFHNSYGGVGTQYLSRTLFFRLHSTTDVVASTTGVVVDPTHHLDTDGYHHGRDDRLNDTHLGKQMPASGAVILGFPKTEIHCTYRFGIAAGPWETVAVTTMPLRPTARAARPKPASREYNPVIQMNASPVIAYQDSEGKDHLQSLLGGHAPLGDVARRAVAIDRDGREVPIEERGGDYRGDPSVDISADTMARIAEIRLEIRPYQWAEFRDITLQPRQGAAPAPIATPAPLPGLSHTFASGLTVSVLGVTERRSDGGRWWRPDGRPSAGPMKEFVSQINFQGYRETDRPRALLMRQTSKRDLDFSTAWQLLPENAAWKGVNYSGGESNLLKNSPFSSYLNVAYPVDVTQCAVRLGIAAGAWQTVGRLPMPGDVRHKDVSPASYEGDLSCALTDRPTLDYESNDGQRRSVPFLVSGKVLGNVAHRIIAIDKMGKTLTLNITMNGMKRLDGSMTPADFIELSFADSGKLRQYNQIDLVSIKEFRLQTRPYEWAEFKGIQLNPRP